MPPGGVRERGAREDEDRTGGKKGFIVHYSSFLDPGDRVAGRSRTGTGKQNE